MKSDDSIIKAGIWDVMPLPTVGMGVKIHLPDCGTCTVVWTREEGGLEHVSVAPVKKFRIPTWDDMCKLKDIFFDDSEEAYQLHPPKGHYVNIKENCLHLWRRADGRTIGGWDEG